MVKEFMDKILKVPPAVERPDIGRSLLSKYTNVENPLGTQDDIYLYYLAARTVWYVGCILGVFTVLVYSSATLQEMTGWQLQPGYKFTKMIYFLQKYNRLYEGVVLFALFPFYLLKFCWNINPKKYDVLACDDRFGKGRKYPKKWWCVLPFMIVLYPISLFIMSFGYLIPKGVLLNAYNTGTVFSLVLYISAILLLMPACIVLLLKATVVSWRFIGPYEDLPHQD